MRVLRAYVVPGILFICAALMISLLSFRNSGLIQAIKVR